MGQLLLHRIVIVAETVGSTGISTLSIAQILGVSERNNRRDGLTSGVMFMGGRCLQGIEGRRVDLDRLVRRMSEDRRLHNLRVVLDRPITERRFSEPMSFCDDPRFMMRSVGLSDLAAITDQQAEQMVELKQAA